MSLGSGGWGHRTPRLSLGISHCCQIRKHRVEKMLIFFFILKSAKSEEWNGIKQFYHSVNVQLLPFRVVSLFSYYISEQRLVLQGCLADCCIINEACKKEKKRAKKEEWTMHCGNCQRMRIGIALGATWGTQVGQGRAECYNHTGDVGTQGGNGMGPLWTPHFCGTLCSVTVPNETLQSCESTLLICGSGRLLGEKAATATAAFCPPLYSLLRCIQA